jgi:hypothetical protein
MFIFALPFIILGMIIYDKYDKKQSDKASKKYDKNRIK